MYPSGNGGGLTATGLVRDSCGAQSGLTAKFCGECGTRLTQATRPAEYKQVTVLFADVVHSMDIAAALGAERLREVMADLANRCAAVVQRYGPPLAVGGHRIRQRQGSHVRFRRGDRAASCRGRPRIALRRCHFHAVAVAALAESLLARGADADIDEAETQVQRLARAAQADNGSALEEIWLRRSRALLPRARGDEAAYRDFRDRYRDMATTVGYEGHMKWAEAMG